MYTAIVHNRTETAKVIKPQLNSLFVHRNVFQICVPALLYAIQNNLYYVALANLDATTFCVICSTIHANLHPDELPPQNSFLHEGVKFSVFIRRFKIYLIYEVFVHSYYIKQSQVTSQLRILTTALLAVFVMNKVDL